MNIEYGLENMGTYMHGLLGFLVVEVELLFLVLTLLSSLQCQHPVSAVAMVIIILRLEKTIIGNNLEKEKNHPI